MVGVKWQCETLQITYKIEHSHVYERELYGSRPSHLQVICKVHTRNEQYQ